MRPGYSSRLRLEGYCVAVTFFRYPPINPTTARIDTASKMTPSQ